MQTDRYKLLQIIVNFIANACDAIIDNNSRRARIVDPCTCRRMTSSRSRSKIRASALPPDLLPRIWEFGFTTKAHGHGLVCIQCGGRAAARWHHLGG